MRKADQPLTRFEQDVVAHMKLLMDTYPVEAKAHFEVGLPRSLGYAVMMAMPKYTPKLAANYCKAVQGVCLLVQALRHGICLDCGQALVGGSKPCGKWS